MQVALQTIEGVGVSPVRYGRSDQETVSSTGQAIGVVRGASGIFPEESGKKSGSTSWGRRWMGTRGLRIASISALIVLASEPVLAQSAASDNNNVLPTTRVRMPAQHAKRPKPKVVAAPAASPAPVPAPVPVPTADLYPTSPLSSGGIDPDKVPAAVTVVGTSEIERTKSPDITDALRQNVPSVNITEVAGSPFQPNLEFRGFVASPVSGTPQGLAVYQNGVRINEAFGDIVNWDLIPTAAVQSVSMVTNNPAFGLNALGGAVDVQMKNGFLYHGAEIDTMGGSYDRIQSSLQWGKQVDNFAVYAALEGVHDDGFRNYSAADIRRFYGDVGYRFEGNEFHANMGYGRDNIGATGTVPIELLQQFWGASYTTPQTTMNQVGYLNLTGKVEATPTWTIEGIAHVRAFDQRTQDGNPTDTQPCADPTLLCYGDSSTPAFGVNGVQLSNPFPANAILGENDQTSTQTRTLGFSVQATNTDELFGHGNQFVVGTSYDYSVTHFNAGAELGTFDPSQNYVLDGSGIFLGTSGNPVADGPVSLRATNQYTGLYALDTFDVTRAFSITGGGRYNVANIGLQDLTGSAPAENGSDTYTRFNPIIGGTYKITPGLTAYAGYSEANRAPTPLELECADPAHPCIIATFLVADPPLKQVVSHTVEAGFRGTQDLNIGTVSWKVGGFRAENTDDILALPSPVVQGFGFFQNVGNTRRQGIESEISLKASKYEASLSYAFVDARFLSALQLASNSPFDDANGNIQVLPGDQIPAIPRNRIKASIDYWVTDAFKVGGDALYVSSQYFVGDESNQFPKLPGYTVFNLRASYQINKTFQVYARVNNVFNNYYANYGTFFDTTALPNFYNGGAAFTNPSSLSPSQPRSFYAGLKVTF
jgi:outer membrane receptor protein involved in Fe transport